METHHFASPLNLPMMTSHAMWNKIQTPNLGVHDPAPVTSVNLSCSWVPPPTPAIRDIPTTLAVLLVLQHEELISASDLSPSSLYLE